jgi:DNA-binding NarL/FixJ family response regulator
MKKRSASRAAAVKQRVFVLDDHPMTRHGLIQFINCEPDLQVCGEAGGAEQALAAIKPPLPNLILADLSLAGKGGLDFIKEISSMHPHIPVLVLSMHEESVYAERTFRAGARGYIMKTEGGEKLLSAIRQVLDGKRYVSEGMASTIIDIFTQSPKPQSSIALLSDREIEVYRLMGEGLSTREISERLKLSIPTIGTHRAHIKKKLQLKSGTQLVQSAVRWAASKQSV